MDLTHDDHEYLDATYPSNWRLLSSDGRSGLVIRGFPVPPGYTLPRSDLMVIIPSGYPGTPLDMFYFRSPLTMSTNASIANVIDESHFGSHWQRWSRHYQWIPGEDNLVTHLEFVVEQLQREVR